jgi:hypothetical protein
LKELRKRHMALSKKAEDLEALQQSVVDAYMLERQSEAAPGTQPAPDVRRSARAAAAGAGTSLIKRIEARLTKSEIAALQEAVAGVPGESLGDLADIVKVLDVGPLRTQANRLCLQIQATEEQVDDALPTVSPDGASAESLVAAIGWGELILAREELVGYEAREIAHIENVLAGEAKLRRHERLSRTEEVTETETITEKESEKDSQSTDRFELQAESQATISRDFSVSTGVNTSGRYGVTDVDTSLDAAFSRSESESRSATIDTAREIVTKAVERTFERVRQLRRLKITEEIRELNRHQYTNTGGPPVSGIYLWVEKVQKVELRHYGRRMMVEFHVPEPALSLHERAAVRRVRKRLPPFDVGPASVQPDNYMCLAQRFAALDVEPPPTLLVDVGWGWVSTINEEAEGWAEDQFTGTVSVPQGYRPTWAKVAWSGLQGPKEGREFNFAFSVAGKSENKEHTVATWDSVVLRLNEPADWPQGVPISGRLHGAWDGAVYVQVTLGCVRTSEALDAWRLRTWEALRAGYEALERKAVLDDERQTFPGDLPAPGLSAAPAAENRRIERAELQKWAVKSMRLVPQNFNAVELVGEYQEISPVHADAQAPVVRFYEDAFEWEHMTYFLYPYHWARRASWPMRAAVDSPDPQHHAFLQAGAARVIVPVTPGFEGKVAWFLDPHNADTPELDRILAPPPKTAPASTSDPFRDLWIELLTEHKPDMARGSGTLKLEHGSTQVQVNLQEEPQSQWRLRDPRDLARELWIGGDRYEVAAVVDDYTFTLDRPYEGTTDEAASYAAGSTPYGPPWTVRVPTTLVVLAENATALNPPGQAPR